MIREQIIQTDAFKQAVDIIFNKVDIDKDGQIDRDELIIAITQLHSKLSDQFPGISSKPTKQLIDDTLRKCDIDRSGALSRSEFAAFASQWFDSQSVSFIGSLALSSTITMVVLPATASIIRDVIPPLKIIPKTIFKVIFGMAWKVAAVAMRSKADAKGAFKKN